MDELGGEPRLLIDPNKLSADGTIALGNWEVSDDGKLLAYDLAEAGSDWRECHVLEVDTGRKLPDHLKWTKFSGLSWTPDNKGLYYSRYDEPPAGKRIWHNSFKALVPENGGEIATMLAARANSLSSSGNPAALKLAAAYSNIANSIPEAIKVSRRIAADQLDIDLGAALELLG